MNNRIALVLKAKNISPSVLADDLGVQRSGISHILNGRNKPSLEFIQKLIKLYPDISIQWILFGEGPMMNPYPLPETNITKSTQQTDSTSEKPKPLMMELFDIEDGLFNKKAAPERDIPSQNELEPINNELNTTLIEDTALQAEKMELKEKVENMSEVRAEREKITKKPEILQSDISSPFDKSKKPDKPFQAVRMISKIVVFYTDRTFVEYSPGEEMD